MDARILKKSKTEILKSWIITLRLRALTASVAPVIIGTSLASSAGYSIDWLLSCLAMVSAFFIQTGTHLVNDAFDYKRGADTEDRLGPVRLLQRGMLSFRQAHFLGVLCFLLALFFGIPLIVKGGIILLAVLSLSCLCGYFYTGGPVSLAYTGLADLFVILFFGIVLTDSIYYLQTKQLSTGALVAGLQIGLLATVIIAINNLRDHVQDAAASKRTLAVRFGKTFSRWEITSCALLPFLLNIFWSFRGNQYAALLPVLTLPIAYRLINSIWHHEPSRHYNAFLGKGALLHLSFGILLSLGLWLQPKIF
jgi:1,4-dihydroxy-2-naphthoate octaprenyltransferase